MQKRFHSGLNIYFLTNYCGFSWCAEIASTSAPICRQTSNGGVCPCSLKGVAMTVAALSTAGFSQYIAASSNVSASQQAWQSLQQSLAQGNLSAAQSAFNAYSQLNPAQASSSGTAHRLPRSSPPTWPALGSALGSGNLSSAQSAFATVQNDLKSTPSQAVANAESAAAQTVQWVDDLLSLSDSSNSSPSTSPGRPGDRHAGQRLRVEHFLQHNEPDGRAAGKQVWRRKHGEYKQRDQFQHRGRHSTAPAARPAPRAPSAAATPAAAPASTPTHDGFGAANESMKAWFPTHSAQNAEWMGPPMLSI